MAKIPDGSVVYAVSTGDLVKIGTSTDFPSRLKQLQSMNGHPLVVLGTIAGDRRMEASFHRQFASARHHGEWFALDDDQRATLLGRLDGQSWTHQARNSRAEPPWRVQASTPDWQKVKKQRAQRRGSKRGKLSAAQANKNGRIPVAKGYVSPRSRKLTEKAAAEASRLRRFHVG